MATTALGPTMAGGLQPIVKDGYELIYYPDVNNHELQKAGKPPVFYWLPNYVHIARENGVEDGDLMFTLIRFAGVQSSESHVGVTTSDKREVAGGVLAFTATSAPPDHVLKESQKKIIEKFQGSSEFFWGIRTQQEPNFRPVIITSNITAVSNLSPNADGSVPMPEEPSGGGTTGGSSSGGGPSGGGPSSGGPSGGGPRSYKSVAVPPMITKKGFSPKNFGKTRSNDGLDAWYWDMQGQGNGSIDPTGQNAYTALIGNYPTAMLWESFQGSYSPIFVQQALKIKFWVPLIEISIRGKWERIFEHFSANAKGKYLWFSGDIETEFNNMRINGGIEVDVKVDNTLPNADKITKYVNEKTKLVYEKFMEQAKQVIFEPPKPDVEAAEANTGGGIWGAGFALKYRKDSTELELNYHEKRQMSYLQDHVISSSMEGLHDEIQDNPEAENKYFQTIYMDDWPRKLGRIVKPVVNWPKPEENWAGQPVAFVSAQIGYPNTAGEIMWVGRTFQKSDPDDISWSFEITQKQLEDVENPPKDWSPDETFVKRKISMEEPPDAIENPYVRVQIEDNEIDLDPGDKGSLMEDVAVEVRADEAGGLRLGPLTLNVELENAKQVVEVTFQATDESGNELSQFSPVKFSWEENDQNEPRFWSVFAADKSVRAFFKYQVRVIVKGSLFTKGQEWIGPWQETSGNGPLMISVPTPEDEGVTVVREFSAEEFTSQPTPSGSDGTPPTGGTSAPPTNGKRGKKKEKTRETLDIKGYSYWPEPSGKRDSFSPPSGKRSKRTSSPEYANGVEDSYWKEN